MSIEYPQGESRVYGHVFESLTSGLYPNRQEILREYVQNAYDAIVEARRKGIRESNRIQIRVSNDLVIIQDYGVGMDETTLKEYTYFGYSRKTMNEHVGFRGIGKLAGLAAVERLVVVTKQAGQPFERTLTWEARQMRDMIDEAKRRGDNIPLETLIDRFTSMNRQKTHLSDHYTSIQLHGIEDREGFLTDVSKVRSYIASVAPVGFDHQRCSYGKEIEAKLREYLPDYYPVEITVNGVQVYKPYTDDSPLEALEFIEVPGMKGPSAICWYLSHTKAKQIDDELPRGLSYRCKGFAVGDDRLVRTTIFSSGRSGMVYWFAGEIHSLDEGLIPSSSRTDFEDTQARHRFFQSASDYIAKPLNAKANRRSNDSSFQKVAQKASKHVQDLSHKITKKTLAPETKDLYIADLDKLKTSLQAKATKTRDPRKKEQAQRQVQEINDVKKAIQKGQGVVDIQTDLKLEGDAQRVYEVMMAQVKKWFTKEAPEAFEDLVQAVHQALKRRG